MKPTLSTLVWTDPNGFIRSTDILKYKFSLVYSGLVIKIVTSKYYSLDERILFISYLKI